MSTTAWMVRRCENGGAGEPIAGPFAGPGQAWRWLRDHDFDTGRLGVDLFIVRSDGGRPQVNSKLPRTFLPV